jgi:uracil phosphoribosyltransferase
MLKVLNKNTSILNQFIAELRNVEVQNDRMLFRRNLERFSEFVGYEISKTLEYEDMEVVTPLGTATVPVLKEYPVIASILRAGLPMHNGLLNVFDKSDNAFVSAYRKVEKNVGFTIKIEYSTSPELDGKVLILADPMLATGFSLVHIKSL